MDVALFITCLTDQFYPRVGVAVTRVLEHLGHQVHFPPAQTCCGQPMYNTGFHDQARALARRMIDTFRDFPAVVTPSASCAAMVRKHAPEILEGTPDANAAQDLAERTHEFSEFLVNILHVDLDSLGVRWPVHVTYHPACHLRELGHGREPETLLRQVRGLNHTPLDTPEICCGFGGTFAVKFPGVSGAMAADKARSIARTGADRLVCNDAGCAMNITGACRRLGHDIPAVSLAEIIAEGLGLLPPSAPSSESSLRPISQPSRTTDGPGAP